MLYILVTPPTITCFLVCGGSLFCRTFRCFSFPCDSRRIRVLGDYDEGLSTLFLHILIRVQLYSKKYFARQVGITRWHWNLTLSRQISSMSLLCTLFAKCELIFDFLVLKLQTRNGKTHVKCSALHGLLRGGRIKYVAFYFCTLYRRLFYVLVHKSIYLISRGS